MLARIGVDLRAFPSLHVAGTNGKGSVVALMSAALRARGLRVGTYTSPHLVDFRERIVVNGVAISEAEVVEFLQRHDAAIRALDATFFETTTAMAFAHLASVGVDIAVVETGLGGRLDSTNVLTPLVAGVTSIAIDHVEYLGESIEAIAREKGGIFKPGTPAVIGERAAPARGVLRAEAESRGAAPVIMVDERFPVSDVSIDAEGTRFQLHGETVRTPLIGSYQAANAAIALAMLDAAGERFSVAPGDATAAFARVRLAGRLQRTGSWILDVAHNPAGASALAASLTAVAPPGPVAAVVAVLSDKDWRGMLSALAPVVDLFILTTAPTAPPNRLWDPIEAMTHARAAGWAAVHVEDFDAALSLAETVGMTALVTGSFHTVGDAMVRLQVAPLAG